MIQLGELIVSFVKVYLGEGREKRETEGLFHRVCHDPPASASQLGRIPAMATVRAGLRSEPVPPTWLLAPKAVTLLCTIMAGHGQFESHPSFPRSICLSPK